MPERIFKYHTTADLIAGVRDLGKLLTSAAGPTTALRNSHTGFLKETGAVSQLQVKNYFLAGRYEIWLRGGGVDGNPPEDTCAALETSNPYLEKVMHVKTVHGPGNGLIGSGYAGSWWNGA